MRGHTVRSAILMLPVLSVGCYTGNSQDPSDGGLAMDTEPGASVDDDSSSPDPRSSAGATAGGGSDGLDDEGVDDGVNGDGEDDGSGTDGTEIAPDRPQPLTVRRLTRAEIRRTLNDLVGLDVDTATLLPAEEHEGAFSNNANALTFPQVFGEGMMSIAESAAERFVQDLECPDQLDDECALSALDAFIPRAWRRPPSQAETERLHALYEGLRGDAEPEVSLRLTIQSVLFSAPFVYRFEFGLPDGDRRRPTSMEMANRLSYLIWGTMPDEELFELAGADLLRDPDVVLQQAQRMLEDARSMPIAQEFHHQWLGLEELAAVNKDPDHFEHWYPELVGKFQTETRMFVEDIVSSGTFLELLTARYTYVDAELAAFYGLNPPPGDGFVKVGLPADSPRQGFLTQGAFLATHSGFSVTSPVQRGEFIYQRLMCREVPPPPADVDDGEIEFVGGTTTRERNEQHVADPACAGCHTLMDPLGYAFEHFDATGAFRADEDGFPIDASGFIAGTDVEFVGSIELSNVLSESEAVADCMQRQWAAFAFGRKADTVASPTLDALAESYYASGDFESMVLATVQTDDFLYLSDED